MERLRGASADDRVRFLTLASLCVEEYEISTTTALKLILKTARSPFGKGHLVKVWKGHTAQALDHPYLIKFREYFGGKDDGPVLAPIRGTRRDGWIMLLTGESGSGKTCLAHQVAEEFLFLGKYVGVGVYLRSGIEHFVVPEELRSRPSETENKAKHTADVIDHFATVVANMLTEGKVLPLDKSVQRVAVVLDEANSIMTYVRGLIAEPSDFAKVLHAKLGGAAADLGGGDSTGFCVAIIVAGTGCGVASCDDATSQQISSHPNNFREVQLPVNNSNTRLRDAIFEGSKLHVSQQYVIRFLRKRPETEPLTTNPRMLWELVTIAEQLAEVFPEESDLFSVTAEAAVGVAHTISAVAALRYLKSNGLADKPKEEKDFYLTLACAFVLFKNKLFNVPDPVLKVLARYGFLVDNKFANKVLPDGVPRFTMSSAIRRTISIYFCYSLDRASSVSGVALERTAADFFSFLLRVVSGYPSPEEYARRMKRHDVSVAAPAAASEKAATVAAATVAAPVPEEASDEAVPDEAATTIAPAAATDRASTTKPAVTTYSDGLLHLLTVMQPSFKSSNDDMLRSIPLIRSTGKVNDTRIVYSNAQIQCSESVRVFFDHEDNAARLKDPGDVLIVINGRMASYADVIVVWKDVATFLIQAKDYGPSSYLYPLAELAKMGMCAQKTGTTEKKAPSTKHRGALLELCKRFPKNQVIPIFVMRSRQVKSTVRGEDYHAYVPTRASGTGDQGSTAEGYEGFFVTPIVIDRDDIYPVVGPNVAASNDDSSAAAPAAPA